MAHTRLISVGTTYPSSHAHPDLFIAPSSWSAICSDTSLLAHVRDRQHCVTAPFEEMDFRFLPSRDGLTSSACSNVVPGIQRIKVPIEASWLVSTVLFSVVNLSLCLWAGLILR
jgi:hypothetical protein